MRILVVGAGAIGGYFGGRLLAAGRNVTFLVRPRRNAQLAKTGLVIRSRFGDVSLPAPPAVTADALRRPFDLILLSCKSYDLQSAADSFAPAVGPNTAILPLLNGMGHIDYLGERFGGGAVLGGQCVISVTLDGDGHILHLNDTHGLSFGEQNGETSPRAEAIASTFSGANFESRLSKTILHEMWEKWVLIATMAGSNCLMRAAVGDIVAAGAENLSLALLDECAGIAAAQNFAPSAAAMTRNRGMLTMPGSTFAASMLRDVERGAPTEADHILGDLIRRGGGGGGGPTDFPLLRIAYAHLRAYDARRKRENSRAPTA
jgi:2-dehydropantoate 2-reductase